MEFRKLVILSAAAAVLTAAPALITPSIYTVQAETNSKQQAQKLVENLGQEAVHLLSNKDLSIAEKRAAFGKLVSRDFNMKLIGRFVLGKHWRKASKTQKAEYQSLFKQYVIITYQKRIGEYSGENLHIKGAKPLNDKEFLVKSLIERPSGPAIKLDWRVRNDKSGNQKIIDIVVENLSMALTHRDEFTAVISKNGGSIDGLIDTLKKHITASNG